MEIIARPNIGSTETAGVSKQAFFDGVIQDALGDIRLVLVLTVKTLQRSNVAVLRRIVISPVQKCKAQRRAIRLHPPVLTMRVGSQRGISHIHALGTAQIEHLVVIEKMRGDEICGVRLAAHLLARRGAQVIACRNPVRIENCIAANGNLGAELVLAVVLAIGDVIPTV